MAPAGGGLSLTLEGQVVGIITPQSPLGQALLGARTDDDVELITPRGLRELTVIAVR